jgi:hypothetical protein
MRNELDDALAGEKSGKIATGPSSDKDIRNAAYRFLR